MRIADHLKSELLMLNIILQDPDLVAAKKL